MKIRIEVREKVGLQLSLEGFQVRNDSKSSGESIPTPRRTVGESSPTQSRSRSKGVRIKTHVKRTRKNKFVREKRRGRRVEAAKNKNKNLKMNPLFNVEPVKFFKQCCRITP